MGLPLRASAPQATNRIVVFGGERDSGVLEDLWTLKVGRGRGQGPLPCLGFVNDARVAGWGRVLFVVWS